MGISNYPNGFVDGVLIKGVPIRSMHSGRVIYVGNATVRHPMQDVAASDTNDGTIRRPLKTIQAGLDACVANRGDIIMVLPGHAETLDGTTTMSITKAGVAVIGLGRGSLRPTFTITATSTGRILVDAANVTLSNLLVLGGITAINGAFSIGATTASPDCLIHDCEYRDVTGVCTYGMLVYAGAHRLRVAKHKHYGSTSAGGGACIGVIGSDDCDFQLDRVEGTWTYGGFRLITTISNNMRIHDVLSYRSRTSVGDVFVTDSISATGQVGPNVHLRLAVDGANITEAVTSSTMTVVDPVYVCNAPAEKGILINWTASTDA